jgi:hypothetical protein
VRVDGEQMTCPAEAGSVAGARTKPQEGKDDHEQLTQPSHLTPRHNECLRHHRRVSLLSDCHMDTRDSAVLHTLDTEAQVCDSAPVIGQLLTACRDAVSALGNLLPWKMVNGARKSWILEYV